MFTGPNIPQDNLKVVLDVANPRCYTSQTIVDGISSGTQLKNLVRGADVDYFYNYNSSEAYQYVREHNGSMVLFHDSFNSNTLRYPTWFSDVDAPRVNSYTFISWFNFDNTGQSTQNIYGGGFNGATSFYMSPGGSSESHGVLNYSDAGGTNAFSTIGNHGGNDGNWHMRAYTTTGPDVGTQTTKFYLDGVLKQTGNSNSSHDNPDGSGRMTWGSWTATYGNLSGYLNLYMYYERVLTDDEILQVYNATKSRFI